MIKKIKEIFENILEVWKTAQKPTSEEIRKTIYTTLILFFLIALISLAIFILIQYLLYIWQFI